MGSPHRDVGGLADAALLLPVHPPASPLRPVGHQADGGFLRLKLGHKLLGHLVQLEALHPEFKRPQGPGEQGDDQGGRNEKGGDLYPIRSLQDVGQKHVGEEGSKAAARVKARKTQSKRL